MSRIGGRRSLYDVLQANRKTESMYAALAGVPVRDDLPEPVAPKKRGPRSPRQEGDLKLEDAVQDEIVDYLKTRPDIGLIERHNSGALRDEPGKHDFHVKFHTIYGKQDGEYMKKSDLQATIRPSGRTLVIEVKREGWTGPNMNDMREKQQAGYIKRMNACGGIGFFAQSVEDVRRELDARL